MFYKSESEGYTQVLPGIRLKTLTFGQKTSFSEFLLIQGSSLPRHSHVNEQTGYLVRGKILLTIGDETFEVNPGDSWCIGSNIEHCAQIIEDSVAIEVFSPRRDDYIELMKST